MTPAPKTRSCTVIRPKRRPRTEASSLERDRCPDERQASLGCVGSTDCAITRHYSLASSSTGAVAYYTATALGWYSFWRSITAQAMRAVLLASATATTSGGRRRRSPITHGSALVAFERSKLALAPLIRSRRKYGLPRLDIPPRRCLPPVECCR